jgi:hypothetical protein
MREIRSGSAEHEDEARIARSVSSVDPTAPSAENVFQNEACVAGERRTERCHDADP